MRRLFRSPTIRPRVGILLAAGAFAAACAKADGGSVALVDPSRAEVVRDSAGRTATFSEVTAAVMLERGAVVVLDRLAGRLSLVRDLQVRRSLPLTDSTTGALALGRIAADSIAVWDAFSSSVSVADGDLRGIARSLEGIPPLLSVVGFYSDGAPLLSGQRSLESEAPQRYAPDSQPIARWERGSLSPPIASVPQWPAFRLIRNGESVLVTPVWARRGSVEVVDNVVWIGDGNRPGVDRIASNGSRSTIAWEADTSGTDREAEIERKASQVRLSVRDTVRAVLERWDIGLGPPAFAEFRVDRDGRLWVRSANRVTADSIDWTVRREDGSSSMLLRVPASWRFLDASTSQASFATVGPEGLQILMLPLGG